MNGRVNSSLLDAEELLAQRDVAAARQAFHLAELAGQPPDRCAAGRWLAAMLEGDFAGAWRESDAIRLRGGADEHRFWQGEPLTGSRVIVRCLHGLGDAVQMFRYAALLQQVASRVIFEVPPKLLPLASCFSHVHEVVTWGEQAPATPPEWDVQLEVMELPYAFRTTLEDLPIATRYLRLPSPVKLAAARAMGSSAALRVGIVWAGGDWNPQRSVDLLQMESLHSLPGVELWSLQGGRQAQEAHAVPYLHDATLICGDGLPAMAATIANLDLVITIDTLAAHLAGALGKPVWVLLQYAADWRWMMTQEHSPWYPTMRLFRQPVPGDWASVMKNVVRCLQEASTTPIPSASSETDQP